MTVKEAFLESIRSLREVSEEYYLETLVLLSYILKIEKEKVYLKENEVLSDHQIKLFKSSLEKLRNKYPLAYLTRHKEFMGLDFYIDEGVLIPRPETETLAELAIKYGCKKQRFLDIGCGSGVIVLSILHYCKEITGNAIDISENAIRITKLNAERLNLLERLELALTDFRNYNPGYKFDFIVSNPPYVRSIDVRNLPFEPEIALDGGVDGFEIYPALIKKAFELLKDDGFVIFEIDPSIQDKVKKEMKKYFRKVDIIKDLAQLDRFAFGRLKTVNKTVLIKDIKYEE
ncbi:peptide chain release factor N(5)-glutamine methyltransferase [Caldisericum exile]|uniref:peptide chain release factor N(5)-glutamine methyltransferase n=1 Tax=Caldisericum exile (strain DSM 21853 / NBRC 104410 / AZM16c01) TaxID=511051 RepID=A0A7U6GEM6_CALEA|nr:peptide chain release factor N(5)-glutamine methyltransferase [Caldisericum exile]BAL80984.1 protein methyltransferase [Caldisericum exile AZM16c01]